MYSILQEEMNQETMSKENSVFQFPLKIRPTLFNYPQLIKLTSEV